MTVEYEMLYLQIYIYHIFICREEQQKLKDIEKGMFDHVSCYMYQTYKIKLKLKLMFKVFKMYVMWLFHTNLSINILKIKKLKTIDYDFSNKCLMFVQMENPDNFG